MGMRGWNGQGMAWMECFGGGGRLYDTVLHSSCSTNSDALAFAEFCSTHAL